MRNMLAGVCGIDFALLVVAADDGVMPQTVEHLQILDLLGVQRGAAVITKIDRVDGRARRARCSARSQRCSRPTALAGRRVLPVSAVTRRRASTRCASVLVAAAQRALARARPTGSIPLRRSTARSPSPAAARSSPARYSTGTRRSRRQARRLARRRSSARARHPDPRARPPSARRAGERCALNLAGIDLETVARGDWVVAAAIHAPTQRIDARSQLLASEEHAARALDAGAPASRDERTSTARVAMLDGAAVAPGEARWCSSCSTSRSARCAATASSCAISRRTARSAAASCSIPSRRQRGAARAERTGRARSARAATTPEEALAGADRGQPSAVDLDQLRGRHTT